MQKYNTSLKKIQLPEYGRNIENLIKFCKTIPDREKRTRYAYGIVEFMSRVKNEDNPTESMMQVYWDHLALLSNFELDIDYPYEVIHKENLDSKPEPLDMNSQRIKFRQYGLIEEKIINEAQKIEDEEERIRLFEFCANHMKLQFHLANKDAEEDDEKIIHDLMEYVDSRYFDDCRKVILLPANELLENNQYDAALIVASTSKKKKKKKKK